MAGLDPPVPSAPASLLSGLLPRGFAVGPSRLCGGRMGLWWVGRSLEAGTLLGRGGDAAWAPEGRPGPTGRDGDATKDPESETRPEEVN
ncbi:hypothetical protein EYF80_040329 [Liparis tanakae]|uniref:Uncharacterized protein n=1 Tax=Liparis tanakae TaxID=230148 RepID=A0A4Z2G7H1_9TELE|nr:hypothetical protein EYF80_040329 [Liparis tanakae]